MFSAYVYLSRNRPTRAVLPLWRWVRTAPDTAKRNEQPYERSQSLLALALRRALTQFDLSQRFSVNVLCMYVVKPAICLPWALNALTRSAGRLTTSSSNMRAINIEYENVICRIALCFFFESHACICEANGDKGQRPRTMVQLPAVPYLRGRFSKYPF